MSIPRTIQWWRVLRAIAIALTIVILGFAALELQAIYLGAARGEVAYDANNMFAAGRHWVETGEAYYPFQLEGPYLNVGTIMLYPPFALYLFVPFAYLPPILWWIVPLSLIAWSASWLRPPWWTWPILAGIAASVPVLAALVYGNSLMWVLAFVPRHPLAGGAPRSSRRSSRPTRCSRSRRCGPQVLDRHRRRVADVAAAAAAWFDWLTAMGNFVAGGAGPLYSVANWFVLATPWMLAIRDLPARVRQRQPAASRPRPTRRRRRACPRRVAPGAAPPERRPGQRATSAQRRDHVGR